MTETALTLYRRSELQEVRSGCLHRVHEIWQKGVNDESDIARLGIAFHRVKFRYLRLLVQHGVESDADLAQQAFREGVAADLTPNYLLPELRQLWERHAEHYELYLPGYVTNEEKQVSGDRVFTPDLVTANTKLNELELHDDKTGWMPVMSEDELRMDYQARAYMRFAKDVWPGFQSYRFTLHAIRFNAQVSVAFSEQELDEIEREILADIAVYEEAKRTNQWPAIAGPSCRFCSLACPLETPAALPKRLTDVQIAQRIGGWVLAMDGQLKQAKKVLKEYCSANGPLDVNGVTWDNRPTQERKYPIAVVLEALRLNNVAGAFEDAKQDALTISHSALKKLMKLHPALETDLAKYVQTKTKFRFSAKQPGVDDDDE